MYGNDTFLKLFHIVLEHTCIGINSNHLGINISVQEIDKIFDSPTVPIIPEKR